MTAVGGQYKICVNPGTLALWNDLSTPVNDPFADPIDYSAPTEMADGTISNLGWLEQSLHWGFLSEAQANQVRTFVGPVKILTLKNDGTLGEYTGVLKWPEKEPEHRSNQVIGLTVKVIQLTAV